jgi:Integral membrane protein (PIN domain superfamily)
MVVIQNGKRLLNQTITAVVTSVIQTSAGRMIFAEPAALDGRRVNRAGRKVAEPLTVGAIVAAAGSGSRLAGAARRSCD